MTFYDGKENKKEIIKTYKILNDFYSIEYLNKTFENFKKEGSNYQKSLDIRIMNQIIMRDKDLYEKYEDTTRIKFLIFVSSFLPTVLAVKNESKLLLCIAVLFSLYCLYKTHKSNKRLEELKKYRLYVEIKKEIEKDENRDITRILEKDPYKRKVLKINTLDDFSYTDIKNLKKEIERRNERKNAK